MAGLISFGVLLISILLISSSILFDNVYSTPVNISPTSVPESIVTNAIQSLNNDSPTQHKYRGGNLISAQKLVIILSSIISYCRQIFRLFKLYALKVIEVR